MHLEWWCKIKSDYNQFLKQSQRFRLYFVINLSLLSVFATMVVLQKLIVTSGWLASGGVLLLYLSLSLMIVLTGPITLMIGAIYGPVWKGMLGWIENNLAVFC